MNLLVKLLDSIGALKIIKSRKAAFATAGGVVIVEFVKFAQEAGYPWQVVCAAVLALGAVAASYVLAQGKIDEAESLAAPAPLETAKTLNVPSGVVGALLALAVFSGVTACGQPVQIVAGGDADCGNMQDVTLNLFDGCKQTPIGQPAAIVLVNTSTTPNTVVTVKRVAGAGHYEAAGVEMCDTTYKGSLAVAGFKPVSSELLQFYNTFYDVYLEPLDNPATAFDESLCQTGADTPPVSNVALRAGFCSCLVQNSFDTINPGAGDMAVCCGNTFMTSLPGFAALCGGVDTGNLVLPANFCEGF